jgi:hypothetical protein
MKCVKEFYQLTLRNPDLPSDLSFLNCPNGPLVSPIESNAVFILFSGMVISDAGHRRP